MHSHQTSFKNKRLDITNHAIKIIIIIIIINQSHAYIYIYIYIKLKIKTSISCKFFKKQKYQTLVIKNQNTKLMQ